MEYKNFKHQSYNLYTIKTDKFRTCHMEVIFRHKLEKKEVTIANVLRRYLGYTSKKYNKRKLVVEALEDLYDASFYTASSRVGNSIFISFILDILDPVFCDKGYLDQALKLPFEFIFNPNFTNEAADEKLFSVITNLTKRDIKSLKERPASYAFKRAFQTMDENSPCSININGDLKDLALITKEDIYKYYNKLLKDYVCDIYVIGNLDMDNVDKIIAKEYINDSKAKDNCSFEVKNKNVRKATDIEEDGEYEQSSLIMLFNADTFTDKEKNYTIHYFNSIFGNGSLSNKLNQYLREENGMCYSTYSMYQKLDNTLAVYAGIDRENKNKCVELVKKALKEMQKGEFKEEEIDYARETLTNQLKSSLDIQTSVLDNYVFHNLIDAPTLQTRLQNIGDVTKEEIIALAKKINLSTIYLLGGTNAKEN